MTHRLPPLWPTVGVLAVALAFADGFWLTSLQGAIGSVARARHPFEDWVRVSTGMLPIFAIVVQKGLASSRRRYGPRLRTARSAVATGLLVVAATSAVGVGALVANSAYEYNLQANQLQLSQEAHDHPAAPDHALASCSATCQAQRSTLALQVRGVSYASAVIIGTNLLLVGWVLALRGAHWMPLRRRPGAALARS
jgi:hypothetical protein